MTGEGVMPSPGQTFLHLLTYWTVVMSAFLLRCSLIGERVIPSLTQSSYSFSPLTCWAVVTSTFL